MAVLAAHNNERARVGVRGLVWDAQLAADAAGWAQGLARRDLIEHELRQNLKGQGENLAMGTIGSHTAPSLVGLWLDERKDYVPGRPFPNVSRTGTEVVGHYTQMIWADTTSVGCAMRRSAKNEILVCRYFPAGNFMGRFVVPPGTATAPSVIQPPPMAEQRPLQPAAPATIFEHSDFGGKSQALVEGLNAGPLALGNDVASSVKVSPCWKVTLYDAGPGQGGRELVLTADNADLTKNKFNDITSNVLVERDPSCSSASAPATLFEHSDFGGKSQALVEGLNAGPLALGNDVASSVKVSPCWKVTLYDAGPGQGGRELVLTADNADLKKVKFNDITSNVLVERIPNCGAAPLGGGTMTANAPERGVSFSPSYQGYYYLRNQTPDDARSLEGNDANSRIMNGAAFMSDQKGAAGTMWQFVPNTEQPGWYRLKTMHLGAGKCLESNGKDSPFKGGAAFMDDCKNVTGQAWRLDLVTARDGNHFYRLRSAGHGDRASLEGNNPAGSAKSGNAFMDAPQNVSGQMWRLNAVK